MSNELFSEMTTESAQIEVVTATHKLLGTVFLPRAMKENRRLTNLLNSDKRFVALTNVTVTDRLSNEQTPEPIGFLQVNLQSIELVKPVND